MLLHFTYHIPKAVKPSESFKPDEVKNELWQNDDKIDLFMPSLCFYPTARKVGDQSMAVDDTLS
jgi:hypothetical protein